jgi:hypothetical protein
MAVGLVVLPRFASTQLRLRARTMLGDQADVEGYAVAEIFEIDGRPVRDDAALDALQALTGRLGAKTVIALGPLGNDVRARLDLDAQVTVLIVPEVRP